MDSCRKSLQDVGFVEEKGKRELVVRVMMIFLSREALLRGLLWSLPGSLLQQVSQEDHGGESSQSTNIISI